MARPHPDVQQRTAPIDVPVKTSRWRSWFTRAVEGSRTALTEMTGPRPGIRPLESGWIRSVLGIWALGRLVNFGLLWTFYGISHAGKWGFGPGTDPAPARSFLDFLAGWDGDRYGTIATDGYPQWIPMDVSGGVVPNNWAFLPVFPYMERFLTTATGMPWQLSGLLISLAASLAATIVLFVMLRRIAPPAQARWAVVLFTFSPLSFIFAVAYAESLYLLMLFAGLLLAMQRRYLWIAPVGFVLAFTRPGALALALALGILFLVRFFRRRVDPFSWRERISLIVAGLVTAVAGLAWPFVAEHVTSTGNAYVRTETAWWVPFIGRGEFVPLTPWFRLFNTYLGVFGIVIVLAIIVVFFWWIRSRQIRALGIETVAFAASYGLYLFSVFLPQQSVFRLMMPLTPLLADERFSSSVHRKRLLLGGSIVLQAAAVLGLWTVGAP